MSICSAGAAGRDRGFIKRIREMKDVLGFNSKQHRDDVRRRFLLSPGVDAGVQADTGVLGSKFRGVVSFIAVDSEEGRWVFVGLVARRRTKP